MYRSSPRHPHLRRNTGVPEHVVERLLAERDQLARNQQRLAHEVERLRARPVTPDDQVQRLRDALAHQSRLVESLQASNTSLLADVHALGEANHDAPSDSDSERVQELLADVRRAQQNAEATRDRAVHAERARLLGVVADAADDLTRAVDVADADVSEGLRAVLHRVQARLEDEGVTRFGEVGDRFEPSRYEAVATTAEAESGRVHAVVSSGLRAADGRLLRPARVVVGG